MRLHSLHSWDLPIAEAITLQKQLASRVDTSQPLPRWKRIAGADVSYNRFSNILYAAVVVLELPDLRVIEEQGAVGESPFPYRTGLLSFREAPILLQALAKVKSEPDVVMLDGQGLAHPRHLGLACHIGLWLERPCLGCAKSRLTGEYEEPERAAGSTSPLVHRGQVVGKVVRTKNGVKPLFVSPGHRIDLDSAVAVVLGTARGYRVPEPTRLAHLHVNTLRVAGPG